MYNTISNFIEKLEQQENQLSVARKVNLDQIVEHLSERKERGESLQPLVVCTHNSRRSHIGQLWFAVAANYYGINNLRAYSAGTMATELNSRVVTALKSIGFTVTGGNQGETNPLYTVAWSEENQPAKLFSKEYTDQSIPKEGITAIMVCTDADENCPFIPGAEQRFSLPFEDPKVSDDKPHEAERYVESLHEIGREVIYILKRI